MFKQSPGWAVATLIAAFVAGGLVGWALSTRLGHRRWEGGPGFGPPRGVHSILKRKLDLSAAQEDSVRAIFERHRPQMEVLWRQMRPRFDSLRAVIDSEIAVQLTPTQRNRFDELRRRMDDRLRKEPRPPDHP